MVKKGDYVMVVREDKAWYDTRYLVGKIGKIIYEGSRDVSVDFLVDIPSCDFLHPCCGIIDSSRGYNLSPLCLEKITKI